jgi:hypothetical protein
MLISDEAGETFHFAYLQPSRCAGQYPDAGDAAR